MKKFLLIFLTLFLFCFGKGKRDNRISYERFNKVVNKEGVACYKTSYKNFIQIYRSLEKKGEPIIFTVDPAFHLFHLNVMYTNSLIEKEILYPKLKTLVSYLLSYQRELLKRFKGTDLESPILLNIAYLNVVKELIGLEGKVDPQVRNIVKKELTLIERAEGIEISPIFGYKEDYSQYRVRGYYTRDEDLKRYFKGMMYLGRMGFYIANEEGDVDRAIKETRAAILLCDGLRRKEFERRPIFNIWGRMYNIISFLAGKSEDLTPYDYVNMILEIKGDVYSYIMDRENMLSFIEKASLLTYPKIISIEVSDTSETYRVIKCFKLFPQRFTPDSYIFQNLVYNRVGTREKPRLFPHPLDIMAVMGSALADSLLQDMGAYSYNNYEENLKKLKEEIKGIREEDWNSSIYMLWLKTVKTNINEIPKDPPFSRGVWRLKDLISSLGFWAELRHDMVLYAKQSYTVGVTAKPVEEEKEKVFMVEPKPQVFLSLKESCEHIGNFFKVYEIENEEIINRWKELSKFYDELHQLSLKGLLKGEDAEKYYNMSHRLSYLSKPWNREFMEDDMRLIVDVHTDPNTQKVLQVGVGSPLMINVRYGDYILKGSIFSFYSFLNPMSERMTDEEWRKIEGDKELPQWMKTIVYEVIWK